MAGLSFSAILKFKAVLVQRSTLTTVLPLWVLRLDQLHRSVLVTRALIRARARTMGVSSYTDQ